MKHSAVKRNIADYFSLTPLTPRTPLQDLSNQTFDDIQGLELTVGVLEKKLLESQLLNTKLNDEIASLKKDVQQAKLLVESTESQLSASYDELKAKELSLFEFERSLREKEMAQLNKELAQKNKASQTDTLEEPPQLEASPEEDLNYLQQLWQKKMEMEYKQLQAKKQELQAREQAVQFREKKIKEFMDKVHANIQH